MLDELLGAGLGFIGNLINGDAQRRRQDQMMEHLKQVEAWQRNDRASAINAIQASKAAWQNDPGRAKVKAGWDKLLENPSALTDAAVSQTKASALSSNAMNYAEGSRRLAANAQRNGVGNSGYVSALDSALFEGSNRDAQNLSSSIDLSAAKTRKSDSDAALKGYSDWNNSELDKEYSFTKDTAGILSNTQYGNSLALTG